MKKDDYNRKKEQELTKSQQELKTNTKKCNTL